MSLCPNSPTKQHIEAAPSIETSTAGRHDYEFTCCICGKVLDPLTRDTVRVG